MAAQFDQRHTVVHESNRLRVFRSPYFDCYGTLIDWETGILAALAPVLTPRPTHDEPLLEAFARHEAALEAVLVPALPDVLGGACRVSARISGSSRPPRNKPSSAARSRRGRRSPTVPRRSPASSSVSSSA